ncbi:myb family transcription factor [Dorcoceras hygrometricum]|uniref:Myb family transcription factor n=1 Tax=Dorcoceras hygrometricum TaxID=472368 RepID=A0A2Z7DG54_9LAMI|nr:myb family transcription factor [Dorcoceras hygrometricum]
MVVDLIGIYVLKEPYCTLTTTNWFLQALSVIPRGSWGDVARRFTMIRWPPPPLSLTHASGRRLAPPGAAAVRRPLRDRTCLDHHDEVFPIVPKSISFLVQADWRKIVSGRGPD